jgi:hypothetical protein
MRYHLRFVSLPGVQTTALLLLICTGIVHAQAAPMQADTVRVPRVSYIVGGGFAKEAPFDRLGAHNIGYAGTVAVQARTPLPGLRIRVEGFVADWGDNLRVTSVSLSALAEPSFHWRAVPYVLAGAGAYSATRSGGRLSRGWTVGAGVDIPVGRQSFFFESRMYGLHTGEGGLQRAGIRPEDLKYDSWQYMSTPITFGIRF